MTDAGFERLRLDGRVAVVTGAGGLIGSEICRTLAARGALVCASDVEEDTLSATVDGLQGEGHVAVRADLRDLPGLEMLVSQAVARLGRLDILVNNGANLDSGGPILECTEERFDAIVDTNVKGTFFLTRAALAHFVEAGAGVIVNIASVLGVIGLPGFSAYGASKGAILQLTSQLTVDYAALGVRVNAVLPGVVMRDDGDFPDVRQAWAERVPGKRVGSAREVAEVVAFLASDAASVMHGAAVTVDGGLTAT